MIGLRSPRGRTALRVTAALGVIVAVLTVKALLSAHAELTEADSLRAAGSLEAAVTHYRRAARWAAPGNPYVTLALARLEAVATEAEREGDDVLALSAARSARAAILGSRSFYVPHAEALERANVRIARLMARGEVPPVDAALSEEARRQVHLGLLREDRDPSVFWGLSALFGLVAWVLGALGLATRALDADDRLVPSEARRWALVFVLGLGLFALGLRLA